MGIIKGVLSFPSKGHLAENWAGSGVHIPTKDRGRKPLKCAEILYNGALSIS